MIERKSIEQIVAETTDYIINYIRCNNESNTYTSASFIFDSISTFDNTPTCGLKAEDIFDEMYFGACPTITIGDGKGIVYEWLAKNVKSIAEKRRCAISALLARRGERMPVNRFVESIANGSSVGWGDTDGDYRIHLDFDPMTLQRYPCGGMPKVKQTNLSMPKPKKMWSGYGRKGFSVTVEWEDGTKTTVTNPNETVTEFSGFCACVAKKIFGSTTKMVKAMEDAQEESKLEFMQREHVRKMEKERKAYKQALRKKLHEEKVQAKVNELRIAREAEAIIAKEASANDE